MCIAGARHAGFASLMIAATSGGDGWLWYALGLILLIFGGERPVRGDRRGRFRRRSREFSCFVLLKHASRRKRPCEIEPHCWAKMLPPDLYSFPSGHSITAFGVAMAIGLFYPDLQGCLLAAAFLIAGSRIILGMHFLSDVLAGIDAAVCCWE